MTKRLWVEEVGGQYWVVDATSVWAICQTPERAEWFIDYYRKLWATND